MTQYTVYDHEGIEIGKANSFGECKKIHQKYFDDNAPDIANRYAGLDCSNSLLQSGLAYPVFEISYE